MSYLGTSHCAGLCVGWSLCDSLDGRAAITWSPARISSCSLLCRGEGFVAARCGELVVVACYSYPNVDISRFRLLMDGLGSMIDALLTEAAAGVPLRLLIGGEFNAKSPLWGSSITNRRGEILQDWASQWSLSLINMGEESTCVRSRGSSVIDTTWASASLVQEVQDWRVLRGVESRIIHIFSL